MAGFSNHSVMVTIKRDELLKRLRQNRDKHQSVVKEARIGYAEKAKALLFERLDKFQSGKIVSLSFNLAMPASYLNAYDDAITAFEMHTGETVELTVDDVNNYVNDKWTWKKSFLVANAHYSKLAGDLRDQDPEDD